MNINNIKNNDEEIKGYISVRNKEYNNENNKNIIGKIKEPHSKNIIFSYKQKPKSKIKWEKYKLSKYQIKKLSLK